MPMGLKAVIVLLGGLLLFSLLLNATIAQAQSIEDLKKGVVKITAQVDGKTKVGTGFIVRTEKDTVYIVTASHVIEGDPQPKVIFRGKESKSFSAQVRGKKGGDPRGLAVLVVVGDMPQGLETLPVSLDFETTGGESVTVIGFPLMPAVPWAVTHGVVTGQDGEYLVFSGAAVEGNSGGPVLWNGKVVGVVTQVLSPYGYAVPIAILRLALRGWGVLLDVIPDVTKHSPEEKSEKEQLSRKITGKDGAPMVLIRAGSFWMGATQKDANAHQEKCANETRTDFKTGEVQSTPVAPEACANRYRNELPRHEVKLASFYLDVYEVTNQRFKQFRDQTEFRTRAEQVGYGTGLAWVTTANGRWWRLVHKLDGANWMMPDGEIAVVDGNLWDHPVVMVSWDDAQAYCHWAGKRLPTEAEWEYTARAGTSTMYWWGDGPPQGKAVENVADETYVNRLPAWRRSLGQYTGYTDGYFGTAPVGSFRPNPWGLYDMLGNVSEWVFDTPGYYETGRADNPRGLEQGDEKLFRGGNFSSWALGFRAAQRGDVARLDRTTVWNMIGFRCAQDVPK